MAWILFIFTCIDYHIWKDKQKYRKNFNFVKIIFHYHKIQNIYHKEPEQTIQMPQLLIPFVLQ